MTLRDSHLTCHLGCLSQGVHLNRWGDDETAKKKRESKTKFTCPECGANAWG